MAFTTQIQLSNLGYLDVTDDVVVPLNFAVSEIQDISKKQGSFSKTILLPGTANNNRLLSSLYDVNIADTTFNQNLRSDCIILKNGIPVFNGFLQLLNVIKVSPSQENPDEQVRYEVAVRDFVGDFYSNLSDKLIEDLSGWTGYNHTYSLSAFTATSGNTWQDAYKYHLTYNLKSEYNLADFSPSIFARVYWDKIFREAGYSYLWTGMTSTGFEKLVIPYNGDKPLVNTTTNPQFEDIRVGFISPLVYNTSSFQEGFVNNYHTILFDEDITDPNINVAGLYNPINGIWTSTYYADNTFNTKYDYRLELIAPVNCQFRQKITCTPKPGGGQICVPQFGRINISLTHNIWNQTLNQVIPITNPQFENLTLWNKSAGIVGSNYVLPAGTNVIKAGTTPAFTTTTKVAPGTAVYNFITQTHNNLGEWIDMSGNLLPSNQIPSLRLTIGNSATTNNYFIIDAPSELNEGMVLTLSDFIPKKIKQRDFISGIVKMFNLYITQDKNNDKNLIIETRDEFYNNGGTLDWTEKFVSDDDAKIQFLPDLQNKRLRFTYKADKDAFNNAYTESTREIYGQVEYLFNNEFVSDVKLIETIFSPTPLENNLFGLILPTIQSGIPKNNIRILYDGGWIPGPWTYRTNTGSTSPVSFTSYPYMGHFDNPLTPTIDYNYGLVDYLFYDTWNNVTDNNLYNRYWKRFVNQIETGKLLTAKFRLNEYDILNLNFRDKIFIHDTYWFINKIVDYDSNSQEGLTTVELISVDEGIRFTPTELPKIENPIRGHMTSLDDVPNEESFAGRFGQNTFGGPTGYVEVLGYNNTIQGDSNQSIIVGTGNNMAGNRNVIVGNDNLVQGDDIFVIGVSGQTFRQSNTIVLGNTTLNYVNRIDAGRNEILNRYPTTKTANYISGSRDEVRQLGTESLESRVDGGRDSIL